ncbi:HAMP domain-containing protein [Hoyosella sp. YIM 151337]|uniref:adenylate/guanylate cyclase domain-containing protein n=1 Tax=Hoyosella sp. YIM 151337 TaxID=2992742 RepID=UPI002235AF2C|nr:adenylate/guanylate cyclase domain-containing protein [Hoyosella sp. YIM 151337]MCW4355851.1 HAMP domain-containing protein [Hoyosella sp. YIM 151337]
MLVVNGVGALFVLSFIRYGLPVSPGPGLIVRDPVSEIIFAVYLGFSAVMILGSAIVMLRFVIRWYVRGGPPTRQEQIMAVRGPLIQSFVYLVLWLIGGVLFVLLIGREMPELMTTTAFTTALAGVVTCGFAYLLGERVMRPVAARALSDGNVDPRIAPSVRLRMGVGLLAGTLVPAIGITLLSFTQLSTHAYAPRSFAWAVLMVAVAMIVSALVTTVLLANQVSTPLRELTQAVTDAQRGDDAQVEVYDGSEVGLLQVGFNQMMADSAERRVLRQLFGQHVGEDVARQALQFGTELGGETRFVAVLFVDMVGSTSVASTKRPADVVALLNQFFNIVIGVVKRHGGFVNKFVGDEALAIFGAPLYRADAPTAALNAARELRAELEAMPEISVGIGVSSGTVVAGNIGSEERFEYTVIGDPVNEAARLTELAKSRPGSVLASSYTVYFASDEEQELWELGELVALRGRTKLTQLAWPRTAQEPSRPPSTQLSAAPKEPSDHGDQQEPNESGIDAEMR